MRARGHPLARVAARVEQTRLLPLRAALGPAPAGPPAASIYGALERAPPSLARSAGGGSRSGGRLGFLDRVGAVRLLLWGARPALPCCPARHRRWTLGAEIEFPDQGDFCWMFCGESVRKSFHWKWTYGSCTGDS